MLTPKRELKIRKLLNLVDVDRALEFIEGHFGVGYKPFDGGWDLLDFLRENLVLLYTEPEYDTEFADLSTGGWLFQKYPDDELSVTLYVTESYTGEYCTDGGDEDEM